MARLVNVGTFGKGLLKKNGEKKIIGINRPYSYSRGCTGQEHEREADAGKSFQMQIISPA